MLSAAMGRSSCTHWPLGLTPRSVNRAECARSRSSPRCSSTDNLAVGRSPTSFESRYFPAPRSSNSANAASRPRSHRCARLSNSIASSVSVACVRSGASVLRASALRTRSTLESVNGVSPFSHRASVRVSIPIRRANWGRVRPAPSLRVLSSAAFTNDSMPCRTPGRYLGGCRRHHCKSGALVR